MLRDAQPIEASLVTERQPNMLYFYAVRRCWKWATLTGLVLGVSAAAALYYMDDPIYQATSFIRIDAHSNYFDFAASNDSALFLETQLQLIRTPAVMELVAARPEIRAQGLSSDWLGQKILIEQMGRSELHLVSFQHRNPATASLVVATVLDVYKQVQSADTKSRTQRAIALLEEHRERRIVELIKLRDNYLKLINKQPELAATGSSAQGPFGGLQSRLLDLQAEADVLNTQIEEDTGILEAGEFLVTYESVDVAVTAEPQVREIDQLIERKVVSLSEAEALSASNNHILEQMRRELEAYRAQRQNLVDVLRPTVERRLRERAEAQLRDELTRSKLELRRMQRLTERMKEQVENSLQNSENSQGDVFEFETIQRDLAQAEEAFQEIERRIDALQTELTAPPRVEIIRSATPPLRVGSLSTAKLGAAFVAGFILPFFLGVMLEQHAPHVYAANQLSDRVNYPALGEVASGPKSVLVPQQNPSRRIAARRRTFDESINSLFTRLMLSGQLNDVRSLAVASAVHGEGKTSLAVNLALRMAQLTGQPTLLVDADLRSPKVHKLFGVQREPGLADTLLEDVSPEAAIRQTWCPLLDVFPAGQLTCNALSILHQAKYHALLKRLGERYRFIIVDGPPILVAAEALFLAKAADGVLLCAMQAGSLKSNVVAAMETLELAGANTIAVVLNGVPARIRPSAYVDQPPRLAQTRESAE